MFECNTCTARILRAVLHESTTPLRLSRSFVPPLRQSQQRRTAIALRSAQIAKDDAAIPFDKPTQELGISPVPKRHLELELRWLQDKVKFANHIRDLVGKNQFDKALALTRMSSRSDAEGQCVVAWNHLIRHTLAQGEPEKAFSLFNDMKKRAVHPDSYTYITLFTGLVATDHRDKKPRKKDVNRVVTIYNSMYAPNWKVKPTTRHANAAAKACALVMDMDSLWAVIGRLEEDGPNSADAITYTIVFDALRESALKPTDDRSSMEQMFKLKVEAVEQGRHLWVEVIKKWREGKLIMDDRLVTSMARLLLFSPRVQDWDDVMNLVEQTMDIDRQTPRMDKDIESHDHILDFHNKFEDNYILATPSVPDVFRPIKVEARSLKKDKRTHQKLDTFKYARPEAPTLAMLLETAFVLRSSEAAAAYWKILTTRPYKVRVDIFHIESYLRICSLTTSSGVASELVANMFEHFGVRPRVLTLRLAMQTCLKNMNDPSTLNHALKIIRIMEKQSEQTDAVLLMECLKIALARKDDVKTATTIDRIYTAMHKLRVVLLAGDNLSKHPYRPDEWIKARSLLQAMVNAMDGLAKQQTEEKASKALDARRKEVKEFIVTIRKYLESSGASPGTASSTAYEYRTKRSERRQQDDKHDGERRREAKNTQYKDSRPQQDMVKPLSALVRFRGHQQSTRRFDPRKVAA